MIKNKLGMASNVKQQCIPACMNYNRNTNKSDTCSQSAEEKQVFYVRIHVDFLI